MEDMMTDPTFMKEAARELRRTCWLTMKVLLISYHASDSHGF